MATARLWRSLGHHDSSGSFRIDGVTGPDEYTAIVDNNVYTNLMAQLNLRVAADTAAKHRRAAHALGVNAEEMASWRDAAKAMTIPFDEVLGVHPQSEGFTQHQHVGLREHAAGALPAAAARAVLRPLPQAGRQAGRPGAGDGAAARRVHPRADGAQLRLLRGDHGAGLVAVGVHPGRDRGVDRATSTWPSTTSPRPRSSTSTTWRATPTTACTSRRWRAPGPRSSRGSAACSATPTGCASPRGCRLRSRGSRSGSTGTTGSCASRSARRRRSTGWSAAPPMRLWHHGEQVALADAPAVRPIPPAEPVEPVEQPYGRAPRARHPGG